MESVAGALKIGFAAMAGGNKRLSLHPRMYTDRSHMKAVLVDHGISYQQFMGRLSWGWDEWSAATVPLRDINGLREQAHRMREMRRKYPRELLELSYGLFRHRARAGWGYARASTIPPSPTNAAMRLKELYGENYFKDLRNWLFVKTKK
jgi:hypothetical protein